MEDQIDTAENLNEDEAALKAKSSIKMRIWNIACIILFAAGVVFLIIYWGQVYYDIPIINYKWTILLSAVAAMIIIAVCFFRSIKKIGVIKFIALIIAAVVLAAGWYIYFRYIPKYGPLDGCAIVKTDPKYVSVTIEPKYEEVPEFISFGDTTIVTGKGQVNVYYKIKDNPFYEWGYLLNVVKDGKVTEWIAFDSATGKYYVFRELND